MKHLGDIPEVLLVSALRWFLVRGYPNAKSRPETWDEAQRLGIYP